MSRSIELAPDAVDVWEVSLDIAESATLDLAALLSADESRTANQFVEPRARHQYIVSRAAIRRILAGYLDRLPREIEFAVIGQGKPVLAAPNETRLEFNTSHSGKLAIIGVSESRAVGIDLEHVRPLSRALRVAERFFSHSEYLMLRDLPEDELVRAFLSVWVAREGTAKAQGLNVWRGLAALETPAGWTVRPVDLGAEYVGAVVSSGEEWRVVRRGLLQW